MIFCFASTAMPKLDGDPLIFLAHMFYAYLRAKMAIEAIQKTNRQNSYMNATDRGEFQKLMQQYLLGATDKTAAAQDQAIMDSLLAESLVTSQERIIKYLRALVTHTPDIDN